MLGIGSARSSRMAVRRTVGGGTSAAASNVRPVAVCTVRSLTCCPCGNKRAKALGPTFGAGLRGGHRVSTRYARSLLTVATAVVVAVVGVTTVLAATTWTVRPGGRVSLTSGRFMLKDTRNGLS